MKKIKLFSLICVVVLVCSCVPRNFTDVEKPETYKTETATDTSGYTYEHVTNDPLGVRIYTLENGLKDYLSVNRNKPEIQTFIAVKAGATFDPPETTGLAHYLEHMMFKGSTRLGTVNWEKEKELLDKISDLYEQYRNADDGMAKVMIYTAIDKLSAQAAQYAVANEYDKLAASMGATGTNAYTSEEGTVYMNTIPSNGIEKWLVLEQERFRSLVLRLFHTELESVFEEFNESQDSDRRRAYYSLMSNLFLKHPYGTQTVLGKAEHLKNPSMVNILEYWETYYVPNNMAVCMSGDLNFEDTIRLVDNTLGTLKPNPEIPLFNSPVEDMIESPVIRNVYGPDKEFLQLAFRFNGVNSADKKYVYLVDYLLNNNQAGLIDLNLVQSQKVLKAGSYPDFMNDYGMHVLWGNPREGQSLEEVKVLLLAELEKIKNGEFKDWLISAIINDFRLSRIKRSESNRRAHTFVSAFVHSIDWIDSVREIDELEKISREELIHFVKTYYRDNYVVVYKRTGKSENVVKIEKPAITPINIKRDSQSSFSQEYVKIQPERLSPRFIDFKEEIDNTLLDSETDLSYIKNEENDLFNLQYIIDMGKNHDIQLPLAVNYLPYLGTDRYSASELQEEFFKLGLNLGVNSGAERCYISISGLSKSFEKAVELMEHVLSSVVPDQAAYDNYIDGILKKRKDSKLSKDSILWRAMFNYGRYGQKSSYTNLLSEDQMKQVDPSALTDLLKDIYTYKHRIFYYGPDDLEKVKSVVHNTHKIDDELKEYPEPVKYEEETVENNRVYFVHYDMVQANIIILAKDEKFSQELLGPAKLFNEYYGGGMASIVFQDIRESKALAYTAFSVYSTPRKPDKSHFLYAYLGTQADKLGLAVDAMQNLLNNMPLSEKSFEIARDSILQKIEKERIIKSSIFRTYLSNLDKGIKHDIREDIYQYVNNASLENLNEFFEQHISNKAYTFLILGNRDSLDMSILEKLGDVKELKLEEIFNY